MSRPSVYAVQGDDPELVSQAARELVDRLAGDEQPPVSVEEHSAEDVDVAALVSACSTPPLFASRRVVVVREVGALRPDQADLLAAYMRDPLATTSLVLVAGGGSFPPKLLAAARQGGEVIDATVGRDRARWLAGKLESAPVKLDRAAGDRLLAHVGDDLGRVLGLLEILAASYGQGTTVGVDSLEPFLGEEGAVPPWELTDAIDRGDAGAALRTLHRMTGAGQRHPLVVMATLHRHYSAMLRLDGADVRTPAEAAELLGARSSFAAGKSLAQLKRLGSDGVKRAVTLLAAADLDLRGETGWPSETVLEILVGRLSRLGPRRRPPRRATAS